MCLSMIMLVYTKQHLSNIWRWIHGKAKQHWGWVEKKRCLLKKVCIDLSSLLLTEKKDDNTLRVYVSYNTRMVLHVF